MTNNCCIQYIQSFVLVNRPFVESLEPLPNDHNLACVTRGPLFCIGRYSSTQDDTVRSIICHAPFRNDRIAGWSFCNCEWKHLRLSITRTVDQTNGHSGLWKCLWHDGHSILWKCLLPDDMAGQRGRNSRCKLPGRNEPSLPHRTNVLVGTCTQIHFVNSRRVPQQSFCAEL
jgi:hypothetical protein